MPAPLPVERHVPAEELFSARSYALVAVAGGELLADERSAAGVRAVALAPGGGAPRALAAPEATESRALAGLAGGELLIEEVVAGAPRLALVGPGARRTPLAPLGDGRERFLAAARDGRRFWTAARADGGDLLVETQLPAGSRRALEAFPPGLELAALSADGRLAALRRRVHGEADELILAERESGELRLLLPEDEPGRFRPLEFLGERRDLLLLADDGGDRTRAERLDLASGARRALGPSDPRCDAAGARRAGGTTLRLDRVCDGVRAALRTSLAGRAGRLPQLAPLRSTSFLPRAPGGGLALELAGVAATDLALWSAPDGLRPLTYGAPPALPPDGGVAPAPLALGPHRLPAELWRRGAPRAGVVWLDEATSPPRWGQLDPLPLALVSGGAALLRFRARGAEGFGRRFRRAADGDPGRAALDDLEAARAALAALLPAGAPVGAVAEGGFEGAALLALLATPAADRLAAAAVRFPDPDPFAFLDRLAGAPEPARSWLAARWGDPSAPAVRARRESFRFPVGAARRPLLLVLDAVGEARAALAPAIEGARGAGRPVEAHFVPQRRLDEARARQGERELFDFLVRHLLAGAR